MAVLSSSVRGLVVDNFMLLYWFFEGLCRYDRVGGTLRRACSGSVWVVIIGLVVN